MQIIESPPFSDQLFTVRFINTEIGGGGGEELEEIAMLQIHPDKVCLIIANAKEIQAQEEVSAEDAGAGEGDEDFESVLALSDDEQAERWTA